MIESPCIKVCVIDQTSRLCEGCGRSLEQIARWGSYSDDERRVIMDALKSAQPNAETKPNSQTK